MPPACGGCGHVSSEFWQFEPTAVTSSAAELHIKKLFSVVCGRERRNEPSPLAPNPPIDPAPLHEVSSPRGSARHVDLRGRIVELFVRLMSLVHQHF